jgi:hypothetical protein
MTGRDTSASTGTNPSSSKRSRTSGNGYGPSPSPPLRARRVPDLRHLDRSPGSGPSPLVGHPPHPGPATAEVRERFGRTARRARGGDRACVAAGCRAGRRPELQGGGRGQSAGGWAAGRARRRGRERFAAAARVPGSGAFGARRRRAVDAQGPATARGLPLAALSDSGCRAAGFEPEARRGGERRPALSRARAGIAYRWIEAWGRSGRQLAPVLGVRPQSVYAAAQRGRGSRDKWIRVVAARKS